MEKSFIDIKLFEVKLLKNAGQGRNTLPCHPYSDAMPVQNFFSLLPNGKFCLFLLINPYFTYFQAIFCALETGQIFHFCICDTFPALQRTEACAMQDKECNLAEQQRNI